MMMLFLLCWLVAINVATYRAFRADKQRAMANDRRISEKTLLRLALFGGWPAAKFAQRRLRHKTRKEPFRSQLNGMAVASTFLAASLGYGLQPHRWPIAFDMSVVSNAFASVPENRERPRQPPRFFQHANR